MSSSIRASATEPGLYFVDPEPGTTLQSIGSQQWQVWGAGWRGGMSLLGLLELAWAV